MNRRTLLLSASACLTLPTLARAYSPQTFSPALWSAISDSADVLILNYRASWSLTCQIKADILKKLLAENPDYRAIRFVDVDWDTFGPSQLTSRLRVERRSTLLVLKGGREVARLVAEPYERKIRALLDTALEA